MVSLFFPANDKQLEGLLEGLREAITGRATAR